MESKGQEEQIPYMDVSSQWFDLRFDTHSYRCSSSSLGESEHFGRELH